MQVISEIAAMQDVSKGLRKKGKTIAFVPTMGYLHPGHLRLMEEGKKRGDCLVVSIFVNPTQFGPQEDYEKYPRNFDRDRKLSLEAGVDVIFIPSLQEMYPPDYQTFVQVEKVTQNLCGISRPTHFRGIFRPSEPQQSVPGRPPHRAGVGRAPAGRIGAPGDPENHRT